MTEKHQKIRVGINGFGRIGRAVHRILSEKVNCQVVAINDLDPSTANHGYLLKYDSTYGRFPGKVETVEGDRALYVDEEKIEMYVEEHVDEVPWEMHDVDIVIDSSGVYDNVLHGHNLIKDQRIKKIIVTHSPRNGIDYTVIFGVNEHLYDSTTHHIISSSICDANAVGPVLSILEEAFGVSHGYITTLHPWLSYQNLSDGTVQSVSSPGHKWGDFSLGRASTNSLIPKGTTLIKALDNVIPKVSSKLQAMSFRTPLAIVAAADMNIGLGKKTSVEEIDAVLRAGCEKYEDLIRINEEELVSVDFMGDPHSACIDMRWIQLQESSLLKLVIWYDNEWGYSRRVVDTIELIARDRHS